MDSEFDFKLRLDDIQYDVAVSPNEASLSYDDKERSIADDFVSFITESVVDELIVGILDRLVGERSASDEEENEAQDIEEQKEKEEEEEEQVEHVEQETTSEQDTPVMSESEKSRTDLTEQATDKMTQIAADNIIDHILAFVTEMVIDNVIEAVVGRVSRLVQSKVEEISAFLTAYVVDKEILHAIFKVSGALMTRADHDDDDEVPCTLEYLSSEYIQKYSSDGVDAPSEPEDLYEPLIDQLTDGIADSVIVDILERLTEETTNHLTDYVAEYVILDILEEISQETGDSMSMSMSSSRSDLMGSEASTIKNVSDSDAKEVDKQEDDDGDKDGDNTLQKDFSDVDYDRDLADAAVNERPFASFACVDMNPSYVVYVPKRPTLEELIQERIDKNLGAYACIKIGDRSFNCIPNLLKVYSPWFALQDWRLEQFKFNSTDVPPLAFEVIYKWLRFQTPIELHNAIKVLQAARHLKFDLLQTDCWKLLDQPHVCEKLAFRLFMETEEMPKLGDVGDILLGRVRSYFLALVGSDEFMTLKVNQLVSLLSRTTIGVNTEVEVFFAALRWLGKSKKRLEHIKAVMGCVRFEILPVPMLFGIRNSDSKLLDGAEGVMQKFQLIPEMTKMLHDAMIYINVHLQNVLDGEFSDPLNEISPKKINPRRWVYHPKCPYHKARLRYPYQHILTLTDFEEYVASIQKDWQGDKPPENAVVEVEFDEPVDNSCKRDLSSS